MVEPDHEGYRVALVDVDLVIEDVYRQRVVFVCPSVDIPVDFLLNDGNLSSNKRDSHHHRFFILIAVVFRAVSNQTAPFPVNNSRDKHSILGGDTGDV